MFSVLLLLGAVRSAGAAKIRRPFNVAIGVNYGFDNYGGTGCDDYQCGGVCYDGHSGTDFPLGFGTTIVAAAAGQVVSVYNGCANTGYLGNTCGGRCGNYVQIDHGDGTRTLYCHLRLNSITVSLWQWVSCGQTIGQSASSGSSTGNHLHLSYRINGVNRDPFAGACSQATSYWTNQGSYPHPIPGTACETSCACSPGQSQSAACGNCGTRARTCGSNCQWGAWSACTGQGPCGPGQSESRACCDCGSESRSCGSNCQWGAWSACAGPDPVGAADCDTGESGPCAAGQMRCQAGCLACVRLVEPAPERCDDVDNDCNGMIDDGSPASLGDPPPAFAARRVDFSVPSRLAPEERGTGWVVYENVGLETWTAGAIWLAALTPLSGAPSQLHDAETWPAHDVLARLTQDVPPGEYAEFTFGLRLSEGVLGAVDERFQLLGPTGALIRCPEATLGLSVAPSRVSQAPSAPEEPVEASPTDGALPAATSGCGCSSTGPGAGPLGGGILVLLLWLAWSLRKRARSMGIAASMVVMLWSGAACEAPSTSSTDQGSTKPSRAAPSLEPVRDARSALVAAHEQRVYPETVILAAAADGSRVVGRPIPAPPRITGWRRFEAHLLDASGAAVPVPGSVGWTQEARFAPDGSGRLLLLRGEGELVVWDPQAGVVSPVDHDVLVGVSWSPSGDALAYVAGQVPRMGLYCFDLATGTRRTVVSPGPPLALPAFSPDGQRLVFASARGGVPALWQVARAGGAPRQLTNRGRLGRDRPLDARALAMPEGWNPPIWWGALVVFEAAGGVFAVDDRTGRLRWRLPRARRPHLDSAGNLVIQSTVGRVRWARVAPSGAKDPRP